MPRLRGAVGVVMSEVALRPDRCVIWRCGKPLRDTSGKPKGSRGYCWEHLKQAQRAGDLLPYVPQPQRCIECGGTLQLKRLARWQGRCRRCYDRLWRRTSPTYKEYDRERKRRAYQLARAA